MEIIIEVAMEKTVEKLISSIVSKITIEKNEERYIASQITPLFKYFLNSLNIQKKEHIEIMREFIEEIIPDIIDSLFNPENQIDLVYMTQKLFLDIDINHILTIKESHFQKEFSEFITKIQKQGILPRKLEEKILYSRIMGKKTFDLVQYRNFLAAIQGIEKKSLILHALYSPVDRRKYIIDIEKIFTKVEIWLTENWRLTDTGRWDNIIPEKELNWRKVLNIFTTKSLSGIFLINGYAGIGKTTFLKYILLTRIKKLRAMRIDEYDEKSLEIPIFISLKRINHEFQFKDCIFSFLVSLEILPQDFFIYWKERPLIDFFKEFRVIFYLDAFDEIDSSRTREVFLNNLLYLIQLLIQHKLTPFVSFIISTRPEHHDILKSYFNSDFIPFSTFFISGFSFTDASEYIRKWFILYSRPNEAEKIVESLIKALKPEMKKLADIIKNPLFLSMLAVFYENTSSLPQSKYELLDYLPKYLGIWLDTKKGIKLKYEGGVASFSDFEEIFAFIAFSTINTKYSNYDDLKSQFIIEKQSISDIAYRQLQINFDLFEMMISERPVIGTVLNNEFIFNLQIIKEYYAAYNVVNKLLDDTYDNLWNLLANLFQTDSQAPQVLFHKLHPYKNKLRLIHNLFLEKLYGYFPEGELFSLENIYKLEFNESINFIYSYSDYIVAYPSYFKLEHKDSYRILSIYILGRRRRCVEDIRNKSILSLLYLDETWTQLLKDFSNHLSLKGYNDFSSTDVRSLDPRFKSLEYLPELVTEPFFLILTSLVKFRPKKKDLTNICRAYIESLGNKELETMKNFEVMCFITSIIMKNEKNAQEILESPLNILVNQKRDSKIINEPELRVLIQLYTKFRTS